MDPIIKNGFNQVAVSRDIWQFFFINRTHLSAHNKQAQIRFREDIPTVQNLKKKLAYVELVHLYF